MYVWVYVFNVRHTAKVAEERDKEEGNHLLDAGAGVDGTTTVLF